MTDITLTVPEFRGYFAEFGDDIVYTDADVEQWFAVTELNISPADYGYLNSSKRQYAMYLFTAHLMALNNKIQAGTVTMPINSADEGTVKIGFVQVPAKSLWQWWLASTPYGLQLLALLSTITVGGFIVGGSNVRAGIRKPNGCF